MDRDEEAPPKRSPAVLGRGRRGLTDNEQLRAMFDEVAAQPLPEELLTLVESLENARRSKPGDQGD